MGDTRFRPHYSRIKDAASAPSAIEGLNDEEVISALAAASRDGDSYLANVLATEALNRTRRNAAVLSTLGEGVLGLDADARVTFANASAARLLGTARGTLEGRHACEVLHPAHGQNGDATECAIIAAVESGIRVQRERETLHRASGDPFPASVTCAPILEFGSPAGAVIAFRDVSERDRQERTLRRQNDYLTSLHATTVGLMERTDPREVLEDIVARAGALVGTNDGYVYLVDPGTDRLRVAVGRGVFAPLVGHELAHEEGLAGRAWATGRTIAVDDYDSWPHRAATIPRGTFRALAGVPLATGDRVEGVIALAYREPGRRFGTAELAVLEQFAQFASLALDRARLFAAARAELDERRRAESAREESEERFRHLLDAAACGLVVHGPDGRTLHANPAARLYLGLPPPSAADGAADGAAGGADPDSARPAARRRAVREDGSAFPVEEQPAAVALRSRRRVHAVVLGVDDASTGERRWLLVNAEPCLDPETGEVVEVVATYTDITDRKRATEEVHRLNATLERRVAERTRALQAANSELEAFTYSVSHDLRAPLRGIDYFTQSILEDRADALDPLTREYVHRARAESQRLARLIGELLELSRVTRGDVRRERVDVTRIALDVLGNLRKTSRERSVEARVQPNLVAEGDARLVRVVLENLLGNAWKYTSKRDEAHVEVGAVDRPDGRAFFVRDDGAGFDMSRADRLFVAFQRLHAPAEFEGTGVGLATVQRIVQRHGGRVWAEGEPGKGATFWFTLPSLGP